MNPSPLSPTIDRSFLVSLIVVATADEIGFLDIEAVFERLRSGVELVRLRRRGSVLGKASSSAVRAVTGLQVDTRFHRTLGLN